MLLSTKLTTRNVFRYCSNCSLYVPNRNSRANLERIFFRMGGFGSFPELGLPLNCGYLAVEDMHVAPVSVDGRLVCQGCPELAQYLPGQPRGDSFRYSAMEGRLWLAAYDRLLAEYA